MTNYLGLYYPFIHFRDENWLKLTSLYWDRMARIVPLHYEVHDSAEVLELKKGHYVVDYHPQGDERGPVEAFRAMIVQSGDPLAKQYGLHLREKWPADPSTIHSRAAEFGDPRLAYVFGPKFPPELLQDMASLGIVEQGGRRSPYWIGMHPKLAGVYMTALAEAMAGTRQATPVSDDVLSHLALGDMSTQGMTAALLDNYRPAGPQQSDGVETLFAGLSLRLAMPADIRAVPARQLLKFRDRYASERGVFQDQLRAMIASLDVLGVDDPAALRDHLNIQYEKHLAPQLVDLKRRLRSAGLDTTTAMLNIKTELPRNLTAAVMLATNAPHAVVVGAGAVALSGWSVWRGYRQARQDLLAQAPAVSYLYQLQRNLRASVLSERLTRLVRRRQHPSRSTDPAA